jgi:hypothetical protein
VSMEQLQKRETVNREWTEIMKSCLRVNRVNGIPWGSVWEGFFSLTTPSHWGPSRATTHSNFLGTRRVAENPHPMFSG